MPMSAVAAAAAFYSEFHHPVKVIPYCVIYMHVAKEVEE